tara:strand:- start:1967 stop:2209 length:243 start_codon:yes stop_codon:yes gene_type:complete
MFQSLLEPEFMMSYLVFAAVVFIPIFNMFRRAGLNRAFSAFLFVPYTGMFIVFGILAFKRWPVEPPPKPRRKKQTKEAEK